MTEDPILQAAIGWACDMDSLRFNATRGYPEGSRFWTLTDPHVRYVVCLSVFRWNAAARPPWEWVRITNDPEWWWQEYEGIGDAAEILGELIAKCRPFTHPRATGEAICAGRLLAGVRQVLGVTKLELEAREIRTRASEST